MNGVLVLTTGQTDVQLVEGDSRSEFSKEKCAALHDEIERRSGEWSLVDSPMSKQQKRSDSLPKGTFSLCTPKLDAVLRYLVEHDVAVVGALIFETRRDAEAERGDPRFAGAILAARLRQRGVADVRQVPFLTGREHLEDRSHPRDAIIRREVASRIDQAVADYLQTVSPARVIVAVTGGLPAISSFVEEVVRFYAMTAMVDSLDVADGAKATPPVDDRAVARSFSPEPAASYRGRRQALELIDKGNLLGAWGAVQRFHADEDEQWWTRVIEWLACFAASLPVPGECDISVLKGGKPMAARAALRVELALRAGDIPRAVHGTVAFFESALSDKLGPHLTPYGEPKRRLYIVDPAPEESLVFSKGNEHPDDRKRPFEEIVDNGVRCYRLIYDATRDERLAKRYLKWDALHKLGTTMAGRVRDLRNDVAHNEPTPQLMSEARATMTEASLWSPDGQFLTQPLIQLVLRDLGEQNPEQLCNDLLSIVRSRFLGGYKMTG
jgi:hypothetical protein